MTTPNLLLDEWIQNQSQPHATVNAALRVLDCLAQLCVIDRDLTTPPGSPADGDCYIPAAGSSGDWSGHDLEVAMFISTAWEFRTPETGWRAYLLDEDIDVRYYADSPASWDPV